MAKAKNKTTANNTDVLTFLSQIEDAKRKEDTLILFAIMNDMLGEVPKMWGPSIAGYGDYHYKYESGREGDFFKVGFSPRKQNLTIYIMPGFERFEKLLSQLGKYKTGKSCLYIKKIEDVDIEVLKQLIQASWDYMTNKYG